MSTVTLAHEALKPDVVTTYKQALGVLQATMADVANRPKEALQAARLVVQKINPRLWFDLTNHTKGGTKQPYAPYAPTDAELLDELHALDGQLVRVLGIGDGGPKRKKKTPKWDKFSKLPNPHKA